MIEEGFLSHSLSAHFDPLQSGAIALKEVLDQPEII